MLFGVCCSIDQAKIAKKIGFDYFECTLSSVGQMTDEEFSVFKQKADSLAFYPLAMNVMLPGTFRLTGDEADHETPLLFLEKAYSRAAEVKTESIVFGSAGARNLPKGFTDVKRAYDQLESFTVQAGDLARNNGIKLAIEPLSFKESNIINLVSEAMYLAERVNHPNVKILADYYHMVCNKESVSSIHAFGHNLEHCHIAEAKNRAYPDPSDGQDYSLFFSALKDVGYQGKVSLEAGDNRSFEEAAKTSFDYLKPYFE